MKNIHKINNNIFITSDEEIKDGDWMIIDNENPIKDFGVRYYKIILTTDQDLINNGVQAIDDEFLEWFVKNPSCEYIKVEHNYIDWVIDNYKIIIPKEEPKQETLEEASKYYAHNYFDMHQTNNYKALKQGFEAGAKWQAERMYSEEEVEKIAKDAYSIGRKGLLIGVFNKWFEQLKNK